MTVTLKKLIKRSKATVNKYEAIIILDERKIDDAGQKFIGQFTSAVEGAGGKVTDTVDMGRRQLAYPINKRYTGRYWNLELELEKDKVATVQGEFKLTNTVMRLAIYSDERPEGEGRATAAPPPRKRAEVTPGSVTPVPVKVEKPAAAEKAPPAEDAPAAEAPAEKAAEAPAEKAAEAPAKKAKKAPAKKAEKAPAEETEEAAKEAAAAE
jgi:ribosomal protein S6